MPKNFLRTCLVLLWIFNLSLNSHAELRDDETETFLKNLMKPIFENAGLNPNSVRFYIIQDPSLNAFVADGSKIFIHSGLLMQTKSAAELVGVLAHETAHISEGHLYKIRDQQSLAQTKSILAAVLGLGLGLASKNGEAGLAATLVGQQWAQGGFYSFTRAQEAAADRVGLNLLRQSGYSAAGLFSFLKYLYGQSGGLESRATAYTRTHPLTLDRLDDLQSTIRENIPSSIPKLQNTTELSFAKIQAK